MSVMIGASGSRTDSASQTAFSIDARVPMQLEYKKRGTRRSFRMRPLSMDDYEQTVRVEFDRGRVTVAAALTGSPYDQMRVVRTRGRIKRSLELQESILVGMARAIEGRLANPPQAELERAWDDAILAAHEHARKLGQRGCLILVIVFVLIFALILIAVGVAD